MDTTAPPPSSTLMKPSCACIRCADRKVKCDRQRPCSACVKHGVDCVFDPSQPPRKRQKRQERELTALLRRYEGLAREEAVKRADARDSEPPPTFQQSSPQELEGILRHYEHLIREKGITSSTLPDTPDSEPHRVTPREFVQTPSSIGSEPSRSINKTQVIQGQGRSTFVDNPLWTRVVEEFHDPEDVLEEFSNDTSDIDASDDDLGFVLGSQPKSRTRTRHPPPDQIQQLWQIFTENVDPLTKVVHVPTLRPAMQKAASSTGTIPRTFEALMFAIYAAAVMSLKDDECKQRFGEARKTLLSRYISGTKTALSRAKFMGTTSLVVLQALVLHLIAVRDIYAPRVVWSLTGVAVRIAQGMGLERDGASVGLPPFETEMRRRIWWMLKTHDFRTAELCGLPKFRDHEANADDTKGPTNINDDQLYPGISSLPAESEALTDVVFIAMRRDLAHFATTRIAWFRRQGKLNPSDWNLHASGGDKSEIDKAFKEIEDILETKYLRYCDPSQPLHLMAMLLARTALNIIRFLTHHPRRWTSIEQIPLAERQFVWQVSVKLLEQHNMLQSNPQLKQFAWHATYFLTWHALIHILDTLRANPLTADADKAWQLIGNIYENNLDISFDSKKPIHAAVGNLCLKAYSAREAALQNKISCSPIAPTFILQLRQQREVARARREARRVKSRSENLVSEGQANAGARPDAVTMELPQHQQDAMSHAPNLTVAGTENDRIWFINGYDDGQVGDFDDMVNMDLDFMSQDHSVVDNATQSINWEQWDAWLADSNMTRPL